MPNVPLVKLLNVGGNVQESVGLDAVEVLTEQVVRDDAAAVVLRLEVRVREEDEDFGQAGARDVVEEVLSERSDC